ncbi:unnamed protein product [Discula destructiva]
MSFFKVLGIFSLVASAVAQSVTVSYDNTYDNAALSFDYLTCSDGANGLVTKEGYSVLGDVPIFPYVGGAEAVAGWNSPNCGSCWQLTYNGNSITVLAVDHTATGFNLAQPALDALTGNQAVALGRVTATAVQVAASQCGL